MTEQMAIHVVAQALWAALWICAPLLAICFVVGVAVNLIQIATSLQDPVFSTVPRLAACLVGFLVLLPWMLRHAADYATAVIRDLGKYAH